MIFTKNEIKFLTSMEECRVATAHDNIPHVKPVSYILDNDVILIATDYETRMYKNVLSNPQVALIIDIYNHGGHKAVLVQGKALIVENGSEFSKIYKKFHNKFDWVTNEPWDENEAPFIVITPTNKTSWGLN